MNQIIVAFLLLVLVGCGSTASVSNLDAHSRASAGEITRIPENATPHLEGQILVRFNDDVQSEQVISILEQLDCQILTRYNDSQLFHLELPSGLSVTDAVREFASLDEVAFAEPNYVLSTEPYDI